MQSISINIPDNKFAEFLALAKKMGVVINIQNDQQGIDEETQKIMVATALKSEEDIKNGRTMTPDEARQRLRARFNS